MTNFEKDSSRRLMQRDSRDNEFLRLPEDALRRLPYGISLLGFRVQRTLLVRLLNRERNVPPPAWFCTRCVRLGYGDLFSRDGPAVDRPGASPFGKPGTSSGLAESCKSVAAPSEPNRTVFSGSLPSLANNAKLGTAGSSGLRDTPGSRHEPTAESQTVHLTFVS